jgi:hypothetical protein
MYDVIDFCWALLNYSREADELGKSDVRFLYSKLKSVPSKETGKFAMKRFEIPLRMVGYELDEGFIDTDSNAPGLIIYLEQYEDNTTHPKVDELVSSLMKIRAENKNRYVEIMFEEKLINEESNRILSFDTIEWTECEYGMEITAIVK